MEIIDLNGQWTLREAEKKTGIPGTVPGCVHTDLMAAGKIGDPFYRTDEESLQWIGRADWVYRRAFSAKELLSCERVVLICEGLDTLAEIYLNGREVGQADNMYRTWEFDVKDALQQGRNMIEIRFRSPDAYIAARGEERPLPGFSQPPSRRNRAYLRKEPCNFGWDWGPVLITSGIWRPIRLVGYNWARLTDVHVRQDHAAQDRVDLDLTVKAHTLRGVCGLTVDATVALDGQAVCQGSTVMRADAAQVSLSVDNPRLWWPNGLGDHPLYDVLVELKNADGTVLDSVRRRIGLRTLRLDRHPDEWGESFQFVVNGVPFFAKGANWIPADAFVTRLTDADYAELLEATAAANMNMLRVWGGGIYEQDVFYSLCDKLGICVWQDFMFACSTYPAFDAAFMANVKVEAEQNVRRLRHHPCLALWCGNNELEQGSVGDTWSEWTMSQEDYGKLFDKLLPEVVQAEDPERDYWPSSPHTPPPGDRRNHRDPTRGDAHLWDVWHGRKPFEWYRTCEHRFNSEFGFQSFPEPLTVHSYTEAQDRNVTSYVMEAHQRSGIGNTVIMQYMLDWFRLPSRFEHVLRVSQILQGMAMKYAVEHWRRSMPRGMGTLYWQLNDCWPVASWASLDYFKRWKALHYMARDFFAPLLISGVEDIEQGVVAVYVNNDRRFSATIDVEWELTNLAGKRVARGSVRRFACAPGTGAHVLTADVKRWLDSHGSRNLLFWMTLKERGAVVSRNLALFARPKHIDLADPGLNLSAQSRGGNCWGVTVTAAAPALWVWLEIEGVPCRFSDNYFHLRPNQPVVVEVRPEKRMTDRRFQRQLKALCLVNTFRTDPFQQVV